MRASPAVAMPLASVTVHYKIIASHQVPVTAVAGKQPCMARRWMPCIVLHWRYRFQVIGADAQRILAQVIDFVAQRDRRAE
jgi:hypothetical protein